MLKLNKEVTWTVKPASEVKSTGDTEQSLYFVTLDEKTVAVRTQKEPSIGELAERVRAVINADKTQYQGKCALGVFIKMMDVFTFAEIDVGDTKNREITEAFVAAMEEYFIGGLQ